ncbi:MAG: ABC transporter ATP-binding protein [Candidatus Omnitrophota bacterium]|nr:MAG: ABC transporter ATP-binding protein [Candidatus Omnitrophota bacterium]
MPKFGIKNTRVYKRFLKLRRLFNKVGLNIWFFVIPGILSFVSASFHGLGMGLLIPILKGIIDKDFGFVKQTLILKDIAALLPQSFTYNNTRIFIFLVTLTTIVAILQQSTRYIAAVSIAYQMRKAVNGLRKLIFNRYLSFGKLFFDRTGFGYLSNILLNFTNIVAGEIRRLQGIITGIFTLFVYLALMFAISWQLSVIILFIFPILYYGLQKLIEKIKRISKNMAFYRGQLSKKAFNVLTCFSLVKAYAREDEEKKEFGRVSDLTSDLEFSLDKKELLITPIQEILMIMAMLFLMAIVALIVVKHKAADMSGFLVYFYILKRSASSIGVFGAFRGTLARIEGPMGEILKVFDDKDKYFDIGGKKELGSLQKEIRINNLSFSYGRGIEALEDISFSIPKGKVTAIVGPTGSGKTTIIHLLLRFYDCPAKSIFIDGVDIREFTLKSLRQHIAIVSQETLLFNDTLRANITYGLGEVSEKQLIDAVKKVRLYDFITKLPQGLDTIIGDRGVQLSGGEKQRVSIARAMLKGSEILILDEATSSLDTRTEKLIQEAIEKAVENKTVIAIAHRLSTIKNADKIVVIEDGRLTEEGSMQNLLDRKGKFYNYWQEQKFY